MYVQKVEGLTELKAALHRAETTVDEETQKVVGMGSNNIKKQWKQMWTGYAHIPHLPRAISYDVFHVGADIHGETGPDRAKLQGKLGSYIAYGAGASGPIAGPFPAADAEEPKFINAMGDMAEKLLED